METKFISFKAFEEIPIVTVNKQTLILGKGQLSPRPKPRPASDWQLIGQSFGMKTNVAFCTSQETDDLLQRFTNISTLGSLLLDLRIQSRHSLNLEESKKLRAIPMCEYLDSFLKDLVELVPYYDDPKPGPATSPDSELIVNAVISDEGHGWLVLNNRLTHREQAIIHTGTKIREGEFLFSRVKDITSKITQQPFALRKKLAGYTEKQISERLIRIGTCYETIYRNECTFDPQTHQGRCERVPYQVEGRQDVRETVKEETYLNEIEFLDKDSIKVLGVLTLETKDTSHLTHYDNCETDPISDHPRY